MADGTGHPRGSRLVNGQNHTSSRSRSMTCRRRRDRLRPSRIQRRPRAIQRLEELPDRDIGAIAPSRATRRLRHAADSAGTGYPQLSSEYVVAADPDVDPFCTRSDWVLPFHGAFHPDTEVVAARTGGGFVAFRAHGASLGPIEVA